MLAVSAVGDGATRALLRDLDERDIRHVYWKCALGLRDALERPGKDFDLLVGEGSRREILAHMRAAGFVEFRAPPWAPTLEGVSHHVALDPDATHLEHIHLHTALYSGRPQVMEWRLPWAAYLLTHAERRDGFRVLPPALDWVLLAIRTALEPKLATHHGPHPATAEQLLSLAATSSVPERSTHARNLLGEEAARLVDDLDSGWERWGAAVRQALGPHRRLEGLPWAAALADVHARSYGHALRSRLPADQPRVAGLRLSAPGPVVALLGADGAGKSTHTELLRRWLAPIAARRVYLGRGDWVSQARQVVAEAKWAVLERRGAVRPGPGPAADDSGTGEKARAGTPKERVVQAVRDVARLALARRKRRDADTIQRLRDGGIVVLTDRFPHPAFMELDGPGVIAAPEDPWWRRLIARLERRELAGLSLQPDLVIKLEVDPAIAHARKPDHILEQIERKARALRMAQFPQSRVVVVDAAQPLDVVQREIRGLVCELLR